MFLNFVEIKMKENNSQEHIQNSVIFFS